MELGVPAIAQRYLLFGWYGERRRTVERILWMSKATPSVTRRENGDGHLHVPLPVNGLQLRVSSLVESICSHIPVVQNGLGRTAPRRKQQQQLPFSVLMGVFLGFFKFIPLRLSQHLHWSFNLSQTIQTSKPTTLMLQSIREFISSFVRTLLSLNFG